MPLSAAETARLDSFMIAIAGEARGTPIADGSGNWRFGSNRSGLCVYANGQYHDFSGGAHEHGFNALQLIQHLYPDADAITFARGWLERHPGNGSFTPGESEPEDDFAEAEAMAFVARLYAGATPIDDTPGHVYLAQTRGLPLRPEDQVQLRWVANYRGDEGVLLAPVTDDEGKLVKLFVTHVTADGRKSPHGSGRSTIRGARRPGLCRLGSQGPNVVEAEGLEKGLAARSAGAEYVVITGGISNLGKIPLPPVTQSVVIARDADPAGSPADQALWRGAVLRLGQGLKVGVTARPNDIAPKDAPPLKDLDDVWRYDPVYVGVLLRSANLEHGRLGEAVENAILEAALQLDVVARGRSKRRIASLLGINSGELADALSARIKARVEKREEVKGLPELEPWGHPVTDIGAVLDDNVNVLKKFLSAPDTHFDAAALWGLHAHLLQRRELGIRHTPRLSFQSELEDSGKTTFMESLLCTAARAMGTSSLSGASFFRETDAHHYTVLWDEADNAFHKNTAPELLGVFNAGWSRKMALVQRQVPGPDGGYETQTFDTFTAISLTAIKAFPSRAMQSRCVVLIMRRATAAETKRLVDFDETHEEALTVCGRKYARWASDLESLLVIDKTPTGLINRIWLNWRTLLQIAELAGGTWPARALAAAKADMARVRGERDDSDEYALLAAIWRVLAADKSDPRRMLTQDLIPKLYDEDEGRWRTAGRGGKPIDEYYLRSKLKKLLPDTGEYSKPSSRRWRADGNPKGNAQYGYRELHFADAFERYLGKGLPSARSQPPDDDLGAEDQTQTHVRVYLQEGGHYPVLSNTSDANDKFKANSNTYPVVDLENHSTQVSDDPAQPPGPLHQSPHPVPDEPTQVSDNEGVLDTGKHEQHEDVRPDVSDRSDKIHIGPPIEKGIPERVVRFPRTPTGRKRREEP